MDAFVCFIFCAKTDFVTFELLINSSDLKVYVIISKHTRTFTCTNLFCNVNDSWTVTISLKPKYFGTIDIISVRRSDKILICPRERESAHRHLNRQPSRQSTVVFVLCVPASSKQSVPIICSAFKFGAWLCRHRASFQITIHIQRVCSLLILSLYIWLQGTWTE